MFFYQAKQRSDILLRFSSMRILAGAARLRSIAENRLISVLYGRMFCKHLNGISTVLDKDLNRLFYVHELLRSKVIKLYGVFFIQLKSDNCTDKADN